VLRSLLLHGAAIGNNAADMIFRTIENDDAGMLELLLEIGKISADTELNPAWNSFSFALQRGNLDIARVLLRHGADPERVNWDGNKPISIVTNLVGLGFLIGECHCNVEDLNSNQQTPLMAAVERGNIDVARFMLEHGADVNNRNGHGNTALIIAAQRLDVEMMELLIQRGADVNISNEYNAMTALHWALLASYEDREYAMDLMERGCIKPIDEKDEEKVTAIVELLLRSGANANAKDCDNLTPIDYAEKRGDQKSLDLLKAAEQKD
jgi:ankyrin repeat protein